jgi:hypothetical protein
MQIECREEGARPRMIRTFLQAHPDTSIVCVCWLQTASQRRRRTSMWQKLKSDTPLSLNIPVDISALVKLVFWDSVWSRRLQDGAA